MRNADEVRWARKGFPLREMIYDRSRALFLSWFAENLGDPKVERVESE